MAFKIITDSASDVPREIIEKYDLHVIPTPVVIEGEDYFDGENLFPETFYDLLPQGKDIKTYHVNAFMFEKAFTPYAERGDEVLYICFSTGIAGTFNAANIAKNEVIQKYPDFKITIIDSKCASLGFGLVVYRLLRMQENGASKETIIEAAKFYCEHTKHVFTVETLEYLYKGGRLSKTSAMLGGMLSVKPILEVDEEGALVATEKVRGRKKSLNRLIEKVGEMGGDLDKQIIGIVQGDAREECKEIAKTIEEKYHPREIVTGWIGCAIGAHTGPGIIAIIFCDAVNEEFDKYL